MQKIVNTYFDEQLSERMFMTGLIYELEDGSFFVSSQDGFVKSGTLMTKDEFKDFVEGEELVS